MDFADDPTLRAVVKAARAWGISPSRFMGAKHVVTHEYDQAGRIVRSTETPEWTVEDRELVFALMEYEAGYCPGGEHLLAETSNPEHADAYRQDGPPTRCHLCTAKAIAAEVLEKEPYPSALMNIFKLDTDVVELNRQPTPPLPPELQQQ